MTSPARNTKFDATGWVRTGPGADGLGELAAVAAKAHADTMARRTSGEIGFFDLPDDRATAEACLQFAAALDPNIDTMVVLGIGGSSLGPRALYSALAPAFDVLLPRAPGTGRRLFFPDNVDPVTVAALVKLLPPEKTLWNVVTKSGGTAETCAQFLIVAEHLERTLGAEQARRHIVFTTDPERGALRRTAEARGYKTFAVPPSVGGRYSVLTPVGLLPAAVAGFDVMGLLDGAATMRDLSLSPDLAKNPALAFAALLHHHHVAHHRPMVVAMSYVDGLYDLADWFRQLWAESLGKELNRSGAIVNVGPTPIAARGATDQHSQLQLYAEGPDDKSFLFIDVADRGAEVTIPSGELAASQPEFSYLAGRGLGELLNAECVGTMASLSGRGRPVARMTLSKSSAVAVGEFIMLLEAAAGFAGALYGVDPFNQPGVEEAKHLTFAALGRDGYDAERAQLAEAEVPKANRHVW